ncbi:MAG: hypothetical protein ACW99U_16375 [Candidatus Thorarchaeota archaeon]|jgi:hypothetical protein
MNKPHWLIISAGIVCSVLAIAALFVYPLTGYDLLVNAAYEVSVLLGIVFLLNLIGTRARPEPQ